MDNRTDIDKAKDVTNRFEQLKKIRQPYEAQIDEVIKYCNHSRRRIIDRDMQRGQKTGVDLYDGTIISAKNILIDGLCGNTATPSLMWYRYTLPGKWNFPRTSGMRAWSGKRMDEYPEVKHWLQDGEEVTWAAFLRSNFYDVNPMFVGDGVTIGTAHMFVEEDLVSDRIVCTVPHFRECYFEENRFGVVDTNFREYNLNLRQLVDKFTYEKMEEVFDSFKERYKKNPYEEEQILHATFPRKDLDPYRLDKKNMPFASFWVPLKKKDHLLGEDGYLDQPSITWRWWKNAEELCGRSPCWDAYVEIVGANQKGRSNTIAAHKAVEPPMVGQDYMRGKVNTGPNAWTWVQNIERDMPKPLMQNINLPYGVDQQDRSAKIIREFLYVDFFTALNRAAFMGVELTAYQAHGMQAELAAVLGQRVGRLGSEAYNPIHDKVWNIEKRNRRIPDPPDILLEHAGGQSIEIDYVGPLAQAQKRLFKFQSINAGIDAILKIMQAYPEALDEIDSEQTIRELLDSVSWPGSCFNTDEKIEKIRALRQQQREQQQAMQIADIASKAVQRTSKDVQPNSPMAGMMGMGGEQGKA